MKILMTGATGLIGGALGHLLAVEGHSLVALSRRPDKSRVPFASEVHAWQPEKEQPPAAALQNLDAVIHLAGESVAGGRWTDEQKRRIRDSRVLGTRNLVTALKQAGAAPSVFVCASAVGWYGDRGDELLDERSSAGTTWLSEVCIEWEHEALQAATRATRVVLPRIGVVLSLAGGALPQMLPVFKLGIAGRLGSGRQWFPWIHLDDVIGILRHAIANSAVSGPVNVVAPGGVTNSEFTDRLASTLHRPAFFAAPEFGLRLVMGEMAAVVLASQHVMPRAAIDSGYRFRWPELDGALKNLF